MTVQHKLTYESPHDPFPIRWLTRVIELASGRAKLTRLYAELNQMDLSPHEVWEASLSLLKVQPTFDQQQLDKIPSKGPLLIIANHPFGVVDGLIMGYVTSLIRSNFAVLVNEVLCRQDPRLNQFLLPIDFRENKEAMRINLNTRKVALERMSQGEALVIFPSGGVATSPNGFKKAEDLEWKRFTAKVIQMAKATVLPVFIPGENSRLFQMASQLSPTLRLSLLLHEVRNKMGKEFHLKIGDPIPFSDLAPIKDRQQLLDHLRAITFNLADQ
ncbi:MAG: lysophospholipid acyltransferase family protein [Bacteroidota bacterium]